MLTGQQYGYDVYGIEISEQPYLYSKHDLKLPVDHIDFFEMKEDKNLRYYNDVGCFGTY